MVYRGYDRADGLWDIEAELSDVKTYAFQVPNERPFPAQEPIHGLSIRVTLDDQFVIQDIVTSMDDIPHAECAGAPVNMHRFKGQRMGAGWPSRRATSASASASRNSRRRSRGVSSGSVRRG